MLPIKLNLVNVDKEGFLTMLIRLFPHFAEQPDAHQEKIWQHMRKFRVVLLDYMAGIMLGGLTGNGWMLEPAFIDNIHTPVTLWAAAESDDRSEVEEYLRRLAGAVASGETHEKPPREENATTFDTRRVDEIIDRIGSGQATVSERMYLENYSAHLRQKDAQ